MQWEERVGMPVRAVNLSENVKMLSYRSLVKEVVGNETQALEFLRDLGCLPGAVE